MRRALVRLVAVVTLIVAAYVAVANLVAPIDLTAERSATLSDTTRRVLRSVDRRIDITAFFPRDAAGRVEAATLLSRYRDVNRRITFRILDPVIAPGEIERLRVEEVGNAAVEDLQGEKIEIAQYTIEIDLTSAIARLLRDVEGTVCFETGHGEASITDGSRGGLQDAAAILRDNGYRLAEIDLVSRPRIDAECDAVVVAGADASIGPSAREALVSYLERSGKAMILDDPDAKADLTPVTRRWGIRFLGGVVVEGDEGAHLPQDLTTPIVTRFAGGSSVVRGVGPTLFPRVGGVSASPTGDTGLTVTEIATTSDVSYLDVEGFGEFDPDVDREGPVAIGAAADDSEVVRPGAPDARIARTRILAWGDVDFVTNGFIGEGDNASLWLQGIDWLTQPEDLVTAVPTFPKRRELRLTAERSDYVRFLTSGVVPGLFLIAGAMVWVVRRSR